MSKVVVTSLNGGEGPHFEMLRSAGFEVHKVPNDANLFDAATLIRELSGCQAVIAGSEPYTAHVLESLPDLRAIVRSGVGFDAIDAAACDRFGIVLSTTPGVNHHAVAEHTIALLMGVARGFPDLDQRVRENRWQRIPYPRVMGRTLGVVGLGRIGQAVATRAVGLGMKVVAYEPFPHQPFVDEWKIDLLSLDDLLAQSDYVSLHLPMSADNLRMMNAERFAKMKPGSVFINTARGLLVDEAALCDALRSGHLRGAGLDVFEVEPLPLDSPLLTLNNVLLSGHVAGLDEESQHDTFVMAADTVIQLRNGGWPAERIQNLRGVSDWKWTR